MGQTPQIRVNQGRKGLSSISSVTNRGKVRFKSFEGAMNAAILIDFMRRLVREARKENGTKVFLVLDNLRVHHGKPVKAWLEQNKAHIEVFYLPSYSPELNLDEMLNANLKAAVASQAAQRSTQASCHRTPAPPAENTCQGHTVLSEGPCQICCLISLLKLFDFWLIKIDHMPPGMHQLLDSWGGPNFLQECFSNKPVPLS